MTAVPDKTIVSIADRLVSPVWSGGNIASATHQRVDPSSLGGFWGDAFVMEFRTTAFDETITLPFTNLGTFNCRIFWGDGQASGITQWNDAALTHTYTVPGTHIVRVMGTMGGFGFNNTGDRLKIYDVKNWGRTGTVSWSNGFYGCSNMQCTATDAGQFETATNFSSMFRNCSVFNGAIGNWNTAAVTNMSNMFRGATAFNQNIGSWNTAAVTNMTYMFYSATAFNQDIESWNTAKVTNMSNMFASATAFNQNIGSWDTVKVTDMGSMFYSALAFNQNIGSWNTAAVTNMSNMFRSAIAFNQDLSTWNMANVGAMADMWLSATGMNQANVDNFLEALYTQRMHFTWATPTVSLASCAAPSGAYADEDPPTTGNGYRYELVNDPETEGFFKWTITVAS